MKTAGILIISAVPGLAAGYLVLTGLLLRRVRPIPITFVPQPSSALRRKATGRAAVV